ncbi:hypothetical protein GGR58DRAFT_313023 [Xylaria digitata]|nr:hypothetical protein GGR58DRAFT_313023 [Xylaria digitata]
MSSPSLQSDREYLPSSPTSDEGDTTVALSISALPSISIPDIGLESPAHEHTSNTATSPLMGDNGSISEEKPVSQSNSTQEESPITVTSSDSRSTVRAASPPRVPSLTVPHPTMSVIDQPRFEGTQGEDPQEYIDDVTWCVDEYLATRPLTGDKDAQDAALDQRKRSVFRRGLRGDAQEWYLHLSSEKRASFKTLCDGLLKRFPLRVRNRDLGLGARIESFTRQADDTLAQYVNRANKLSLGASDSQLNRLRERLYKNICEGGHIEDERLQERIMDRLVSQNKITEFGEFKKECTFVDVADVIVACALKPGKEGEFLDQVEKGMRRGNRRYSGEELVKELGNTLTETLQKFKEATSAHAYTPPAPAYQPSYQPTFNPMAYVPPSSHYAQPYYGQDWIYPTNPQTFQVSVPQVEAKKVGFVEPEKPQNNPPPSGPGPFSGQPDVLSWQRESNRGGRGGRGGRGRGGRGGYHDANSHNHSTSFWAGRAPCCWNCGVEGHVAPECDKEDRPWSEKNRIRDALEKGQPLPTDLRYDLPLKKKTPAPGEQTQVAQPSSSLSVNSVQVITPPGEKASDDSLGFLTEEEKLFINDQWPGDTCSAAMMRVNESSITIPSLPSEAGPSDPDRNKRRRLDDQGKLGDDEPMYDVSPEVREVTHKGKEKAMTPPPPKITRPERHRRSAAQAEAFRDELSRRLVEARKKVKQRDTIPIRAYENHRHNRIDIEQLLRDTPFPQITWGQLLDRSPAIRAQLTRAMGLSPAAKLERPRKLKKGRVHHSAIAQHEVEEEKKPNQLITMLSKVSFLDRTRFDDGKTHLGYVTGLIRGVTIDRCLIDGGSLAELISPGCAIQHHLVLRECPQDTQLRVANDDVVPITHYVVFPLVVGGILTVIKAYVAGHHHTYNVLLGKSWLRRNSAVVDYGTEEITIRGMEGNTAKLIMSKAPPVGPFVVKGSPHEEQHCFSEPLDDDSEDEDDEEDSDYDPEEDDIIVASLDPAHGPTDEDLVEEILNIAELALSDSLDSKN